MTHAEVSELSRRRNAWISGRQFDEMVDGFYADSAQLLPSGEAPVIGKGAIRDFWRATPENGLVSLSLEAGEVHTSGDLAFEIGRFSRTLRPTHGAPFQDNGKYMVVYRREPSGEWRATAEMFNSDSRR